MPTSLAPYIVGIMALLGVASLVGFLLEKHRPSETIRNLNARTRSWWVMVAVLGGALLLGRAAIIVLFAFLSFVALREFWTLAPSRRGDHRALFLSFFVVLPAQYLLVASDWYGLFA